MGLYSICLCSPFSARKEGLTPLNLGMAVHRNPMMNA
jgi:hypothetical protein